jgi:hypothetical protein
MTSVTSRAPATERVVETENLPPLFQRWMDEALPGPIPRERKATCDACAMCAHSAEQRATPAELTGSTFRPDTKCCTYLPELPNFLVGAVLRDDDANGRESLRARIRAGLGVTPLRVGSTPVYALLHRNAGGAEDRVFGRSRAMLCPHFIDEGGGLCGIWKHRNSVCATYFCKHVRGAVGQQFWDDVRRLLAAAESELSVWCALELGLDVTALRRLLSVALGDTEPLGAELGAQGDTRDAGAAARVWGKWLDREEEFYRQSALLVDALPWDDVGRIGGARVQSRAAIVQDGFARLQSTAVPDRVAARRVSYRFVDNGRALLTTHNPTDPAVLSRRVLDLLHYFDGTSTHNVLSRIAEIEGVRLDEQLVRALVDYGVLSDLDAV